ncbi:hypothetical protein [Lichenihabitans psoromatis]|uniref:hypothetical protein n=1 Tax=Lichenihabitans psoromatis TaxID=2528642 RepID=UPI0010382E0C|nr:hypothetical protein [Lichenihabitans psoromatis]
MKLGTRDPRQGERCLLVGLIDDDHRFAMGGYQTLGKRLEPIEPVTVSERKVASAFLSLISSNVRSAF